MKVNIAGLRQNVDYLKSLDFNYMMRIDNDGGAPPTLNIPLATTRDVHMGDVVATDADAKTDKELVVA